MSNHYLITLESRAYILSPWHPGPILSKQYHISPWHPGPISYHPGIQGLYCPNSIIYHPGIQGLYLITHPGRILSTQILSPWHLSLNPEVSTRLLSLIQWMQHGRTTNSGTVSKPARTSLRCKLLGVQSCKDWQPDNSLTLGTWQ